MSNKRITDLTELTTPTTDDVFPVVDIATNTTTKVQLANLPVQTAVTTALATKQATLVSGTNIKTVNSTTLLGSGDVAVQETLVSGTNIKTLNSVSLLGAGNIVLAATPSGVSGAIQFSNGSAFASDATNFFWDDTNNRLGIGTNAPLYGTQLQSDTSGANTLIWSRAAGSLNTSGIIFSVADNTVSGNQYHKGGIFFKGDGAGAGRGSLILVSNTANDASVASSSNVGIALLSSGNNSIGTLSDLSARVGIKGSGSTSATTSLLVQNSAGTAAFQIKDDTFVTFPSTAPNYQVMIGGQTGTNKNGLSIGYTIGGTVYSQGGIFGNPNTATNELYGNTNSILSFKDGEILIKNANNGATINNPSAILTIDSTTKGVLFPRMTTTQRNAIASPATGLVVYDSTTNKLQCYNGSTWNDLF
jgi:hypothetical protein